ncbi:MAG TPA: hypothetical protein DCE56_07100 [Cyanobacteria bacterium UBA8553]|nr:hypothetical protein [Cyanobacteria bacterium UBA8553]
MHPIFWGIIVLSAFLTCLVLSYKAWRRIFPSASSRRFQRRKLADEQTKFRYSQKVSALNQRTVSKPSQTNDSYQVAGKGTTPPTSSTPPPINNSFEGNFVSADEQTLIKPSQKDNSADKSTLIKPSGKDNSADEQTLIRHPQKDNSADKPTLIKPSGKDNSTDEQTLIRHPQKDKPTQLGRHQNNNVKPDDEYPRH